MSFWLNQTVFFISQKNLRFHCSALWLTEIFLWKTAYYCQRQVPFVKCNIDCWNLWPSYYMAFGHHTTWHLAITQYGLWPSHSMAFGHHATWPSAITLHGLVTWSFPNFSGFLGFSKSRIWKTGFWTWPTDISQLSKSFNLIGHMIFSGFSEFSGSGIRISDVTTLTSFARALIWWVICNVSDFPVFSGFPAPGSGIPDF